MAQEDLSGLALLGNLLGLPKALQQASQQSSLERTLLTQNAGALGVTPDEIAQLTPEPGLDIFNPLKHRTASGDPSTYGKILATIGGVGNVLSSLVGQPVGPPRVDLSTLTSLANLRSKKEKETALGGFAGTLKNPQAQAAARAGLGEVAARLESPSDKGQSSEMAVLIQQGRDQGLSDPDARSYALREIDRRRLARAGATGAIQVQGALAKERQTTALHAQRVESILDPLQGAVDRQLHADSLVGRLAQGGKLLAFKNAPGTVGRAMGLSDEESNQLADDIAILESPAAFGGQILKGLGEDAGRLSDYDIQRISRRLPTLFDSHVIATAKLGVFKRLIRSAQQYGAGQDVPTSLVDRFVKELDQTSRPPGGKPRVSLTPPGVAAPRSGEGEAAPGGADRIEQLLQKHGM